jgi:hypothetical protein
VTLIYGSGHEPRTVPALARDIQKISSQEVFPGQKPGFMLARFHFPEIESSNQVARTLDIQVGTQGKRTLVLMEQHSSSKNAKVTVAYRYQKEEMLIGPVFELTPDPSLTYQFQCISSMGESSAEPAGADAVLPYSGGAAGAGAR